jgi:hypothetical protein
MPNTLEGNVRLKINDDDDNLCGEVKSLMAEWRIDREQQTASLRIEVERIVAAEMERQMAQGHSAHRAAEEFNDLLHRIRIEMDRSLTVETERRRIRKRAELYWAAATEMERYTQECTERERRVIEEVDTKFKEGHDEIVRLAAAEMKRCRARKRIELDWCVATQIGLYTEKYADMRRCAAGGLDDTFKGIYREIKRRETAEAARRMAQEGIDMERDAVVEMQRHMERLQIDAERSVAQERNDAFREGGSSIINCLLADMQQCLAERRLNAD